MAAANGRAQGGSRSHGTEGRHEGDQLGHGQGTQASTQVVGCGDHQGVQLIGRLGAGLHRRSAGQPQGADHLDLAIPGLGLPDDRPGLHGPRGRFGVERIGLAASAPCLSVVAVGALDFDDGHAARTEPARQPGAVTPGPLDPDLLDHPEVTRPRQERREASGRRRDAAGSQAPTELIERHPDVLIGMGIDTDRDPNLVVLSIAAG